MEWYNWALLVVLWVLLAYIRLRYRTIVAAWVDLLRWLLRLLARWSDTARWIVEQERESEGRDHGKD